MAATSSLGVSCATSAAAIARVNNRVHSLVAMEALESTPTAAASEPDLISKIRRHCPMRLCDAVLVSAVPTIT